MTLLHICYQLPIDVLRKAETLHDLIDDVIMAVQEKKDSPMDIVTTWFESESGGLRKLVKPISEDRVNGNFFLPNIGIKTCQSLPPLANLINAAEGKARASYAW